MTLKRQWILVLILTTILAVVINSVVLSSRINSYFISYSTTNYKENLKQIMNFSQKMLVSKDYTEHQLHMQLEAYLSDPITRIRLYDKNGKLLGDVYDSAGMMNGMMGRGMMGNMMGSMSTETVSMVVSASGVKQGRLNITKYSSIGNSLETRRFKVSLIINSILSFGVVLILVLLMGVFIGNKMSRDLMNTADFALDMDLGNTQRLKLSSVREIRIIQQSLEALLARLKLKQTSRKKLVDELIHQTRTPLTILKTHLEGFEDGIITMDPAEIKLCETQLDQITSIIANMSGMIDAEKDIESINVEEIELNQLLRQILGGLKLQFDKKQIDLSIENHQRIIIITDKYKLSQCIYNILTNAYKFTKPKGIVTVSYEESGEEILLTIRDTGIGIHREDQLLLFDAYFRGTNADRIEGEGIGLYVVKQNLDKIRGRISVESEPGKGSTFIISIPKMYSI